MNRRRTEMDSSNLYELFGGKAACRRLSVAFYARVERDPILRPMFPGKSFTCAIEEFTAFLAQFLGGPTEDSQRRWWLSLRESHMRFKIGPAEREAWIKNMVQALDDVHFDEPIRKKLLALFERSSAYVINRGDMPAVDGQRETRGNCADAEISCRWEAQTRLDEAVAAIRSGNAENAIALAESLACKACSRSVHTGLLASMIRSGHIAMLDYVRVKLTGDPAFAAERYAGRTLLHEAAAAGSLPTVELLLSVGADPNALGGGRHTPLYCLGNECEAEGAGSLVRALVRSGADVNANDGVKRCTALHMAARRGSAEIAEALLECGADIEARDSLGETPLRRAVNCDRVGLASLLLARGADVQATGSKGITPIFAARSTAMKLLLRGAALDRIRIV